MQLRRLLVGQHAYYWRSTSRQLTSYRTSPNAVEVVIYQENCRNAPLRLVFKEDDNDLLTDKPEPGQWLLHEAGAATGWFYNGVPTALGEMRPTINFNRPGVIVRLLQFFLLAGWEPAGRTRPFEVNDALKYLNVLNLTNLSGT